MIRRGLPRDDHQIHGTDFRRRPECLHPRQLEVAVHALDLQTALRDRIKIRTHQESHVLARSRQPAAIIQTDGPGTDYGHALECPVHG